MLACCLFGSILLMKTCALQGISALSIFFFYYMLICNTLYDSLKVLKLLYPRQHCI
jgi:hypothetical protein